MAEIPIHKINLDEVDLNGSILVFTTNGNIKKNGRAVMGRGIAKWVRDNVLFYDKFSKIYCPPDLILARRISEKGNIPFAFKSILKSNPNTKFVSISFPTKHNWWEKSDLDLIRSSATKALEIFSRKSLRKYTRIYLPLFGTENGKLSVQEILPILKLMFKNLTSLRYDVFVFKRK